VLTLVFACLVVGSEVTISSSMHHVKLALNRHNADVNVMRTARAIFVSMCMSACIPLKFLGAYTFSTLALVLRCTTHCRPPFFPSALTKDACWPLFPTSNHMCMLHTHTHMHSCVIRISAVFTSCHIILHLVALCAQESEVGKGSAFHFSLPMARYDVCAREWWQILTMIPCTAFAPVAVCVIVCVCLCVCVTAEVMLLPPLPVAVSRALILS
jgi:hypothetical protein